MVSTTYNQQPKTVANELKRLNNTLAKLEKWEDKVALFKSAMEETPLKVIVGLNFDQRAKSRVPLGVPRYKINNGFEVETSFRYYLSLNKIFYFFDISKIHGVEPLKIEQNKLNDLYLEMLENIHTEDADLINNVKDRKWNYSEITKELVKSVLNIPVDPEEV
jgi:hypothetical protein